MAQNRELNFSCKFVSYFILIVPQAVRCMPTFYMGATLQRFFSWQQVDNHSDFMSFTHHSLTVVIDSCKSAWGCLGSCTGLVKGQVQRRGGAWAPESAGPQCLGAAHTHPSGVSAELTALSTVWGALCVSLHCLLASWIGPLLQWASVCERFTKRPDRRGIKKRDFIKRKGWG